MFCTVTTAQFERTRVNLVCPCSLVSESGRIASVSFGLVNHTDASLTDIYATIAISGKRDSGDNETETYVAFNDTVLVNERVEPDTVYPIKSFEVELGDPPAGRYYFELLLHEGEVYSYFKVLDSVWFKGENEAPFTSINASDANYLADSDDDGVGDINEELEGTDPNDPASFPEVPLIDVLVLHEENSFEHFNVTPETFLAFDFAVTNDMYERSESPVRFRPIGLLDTNDVPEIDGGVPLNQSDYLALLEEYRADIVLVYRKFKGGICGFAVVIGGWGDKGFLHPNERLPYTEIFLDPTVCGANVTAHEIGHLMGLGHSFEQLSTGAYVWSRGHAQHGEFGTIMSYASQLFSAVSMDVFSNPQLDCHGKPCGVLHTELNATGSADSAKSLNAVKYQFAHTFSPDSTFDFDGDGVGASDDAFPIDPLEWSDTDGDQFGDNRDAFPENPLEWSDTDNDGIGDNQDRDIDGDGIQNSSDLEPFDHKLTTLKLKVISSIEEGDEFGYAAVQVDDLDGGGVRDLAVSAPGANDGDITEVGKLYLLSLETVLSPPRESNTSNLDLSELVDIPNHWVLIGQSRNERLGRQLEVLNHEMGPPELLILSEHSLYILTMDAETLDSLDIVDEIGDRRLNMGNCHSLRGCIQVAIDEDLFITDIADAGDLNNDSRSDVGIVTYSANRFRQLQVYFLNRESLVNGENSQASKSLVDVFESNESSFLLTTTGYKGFANLEPLANTDGNVEPMLALGILGQESPGRVYLLDHDQLQRFGDFDDDRDRQVDLDSLVSLDGSIRITNLDDSVFGMGLDFLTDLDDDQHNDLLIWGSPFNAFAFTIDGISNLADYELEPEGSIELTDDFWTASGMWRLRSIWLGTRTSGSKVLHAINKGSPDVLATSRYRSLFLAELKLLNDRGGPSDSKLIGEVNLGSLIRHPGFYDLRIPIGPRGFPTISGVIPLGDLDQDGQHELAFSVTSEEREGAISSLYIVHSSELDALDRTDGRVDHIVLLHNDLQDTDGDGILNLHDHDDDNDGVLDFIDVYPLLSEYRYDADHDFFANLIDAFPLDPFEHSDLDFDQIGDNEDLDIDGDGVPNFKDPFPLDTDDDGLINDEDPDDDNDSVLDFDDAFPIDPSESLDSDGDGVGDNADAFANDPTEQVDTDDDGVGNNADTDDDDDGFDDADDAFPLIASEWLDSDGDGYGDNSDMFPLDPYEWEDKDGDGFGDNYGTESIRSYRLISDWVALDSSSAQSAGAITFSLGDIDRDDKDDLEISNALRGEIGYPTIVLSGSDLAELDDLDGESDNTIDLNSVQSAPASFRFIDTTATESALPYSGATTGDLNGDGARDFVFSDLFASDYSGSVTIVYGDDWNVLDTSDGTVDGQIDLSACTDRDWCTRVRSSHPSHGFGANNRLAQDPSGREDLVLSIGTVYGEIRSSSTNGVGSIFAVPDRALVSSVEQYDEADIPLDFLSGIPETYVFYAESNVDFDGPSVGTFTVGRINDLDRDGIDELIINSLDSNELYVLASSDFPLMDSADGQIDQKVDLANSYVQPNSFKLKGFNLDLFTAISLTNLDTSKRDDVTYLLPLLRTDDPLHAVLVDSRRLEELDRMDGYRNGVITAIQPSEHNAHAFPGIGNIKICQPDEPGGRVLGLADPLPEVDSDDISQSRLYVFDARALRYLDQLDLSSDGNIDLSATIGERVDNVWALTFGDLAEHSYNIGFECAGDFDGDTRSDIAVSLFDRNGDEFRSQVILISYRNLLLLDRLDGNLDGVVDVSKLWSANTINRIP